MCLMMALFGQSTMGTFYELAVEQSCSVARKNTRTIAFYLKAHGSYFINGMEVDQLLSAALRAMDAALSFKTCA